MRSSLASVLLGLSFVAACNVGDAGTGPGGGDDVQGQPDANNQQNPVPRVSLSVDKPTVTTDLNVDNTIVVSATGSMGFAGDVTLTASVSDGSGGALNGWTTLASSTITLTTDGTGTANLVLKVPPNAPSLTGTIKVTATSSAASAEATVAVTANPVVLVEFTEANGVCAYPFSVANPLRVKAGRLIKIVDKTTRIMTIHVDPGIDGVPHQSGTMSMGQSYDKTPLTAGDSGIFYCHSDAAGQIPDANVSSARPRLVVE